MFSPPASDGISIDADMSTGPSTIVSSRSLAAQISSTLMSPRAVSICASMPTRDWRPVTFSIWVSR